MRVFVRFPAALRQAGGAPGSLDLELGDAATVRDLLDALRLTQPAIERRIRDESGRLRRHVNVFVGERNVKDHGNLDEPLRDGIEVTVLPAVSGG